MHDIHPGSLSEPRAVATRLKPPSRELSLSGTTAFTVCLGTLRRFHLLDQIHVRGKIAETLSHDLAHGIEALVRHEFLESFLQFINHFYAVKHHAGAQLHSGRTQQHKFDCIVGAFNTTDAAD